MASYLSGSSGVNGVSWTGRAKLSFSHDLIGQEAFRKMLHLCCWMQSALTWTSLVRSSTNRKLYCRTTNGSRTGTAHIFSNRIRLRAPSVDGRETTPARPALVETPDLSAYRTCE